MTGKIIINGASDNLIEVEIMGIRNEEFNIDCDERYALAVSDGTLLRVRYDEDGIWRFTPVVIGSSNVSIMQGVDDDRHSDVVTMIGENLIWVALVTQFIK